MADRAQGKTKNGLTGRSATELKRTIDRLLHNKGQLSELLLDSLPHPAMLIRKDRTTLAANRIARQLGAGVGNYCWRSFGQSDFIPDKDKQYINDHKQVPPGGSRCVFCQADEALDKQAPTHNPEIKAWDKIWDMHWIPLDEETCLHYAIDVTYVTKEDEKLRMSELKHRTLAENIPGLVYRMLIRQNNTMLFFNNMLKLMTGFEQSELTTGEVCSIAPHILPEDRDRVAAKVKHACNEKEPFEVEYRFKHKDKSIKWYKEIGRPVFGPKDELLFIDGIITDITDRKRAEEALRESEGRFRSLFEQAAVGVSQVETATGRFLKANRKYCDIVGYSLEEMMSRTFQEITHPDDLPKDLDNMKKLVKGDIREFTMEKRYLHKSGEIVWVSLSVSARWDVGEEPTWHIAVVEDITERKRTEEAMRDNEEKWRSLAETAPVVIMNVSRDGTIKFINRVLEQHTLEQVVGTRVYDHLPQDQHDIMRKSVERVFETGKPASFEILGEGPEGPASSWYENHIGPILDQNGKVANVTMVAIDITERKRIEKELREESAFRKAVIERAAEGICVCHDIEEYPHLRFTVWNERMMEITGYLMEEINHLGWYQTVYPNPELKQKAVERMERMRQGDDLVAEEWEITRKDGLKRLLAISTSVIVTEGSQTHVLALMHDITEEKKAWKEREKMLKTLTAKNQ
jgi:PAS domain S-box-containing protein